MIDRICTECGGLRGVPQKSYGLVAKWCGCAQIPAAAPAKRVTLAEEGMRHYYNRDPEALRRLLERLTTRTTTHDRT